MMEKIRTAANSVIVKIIFGIIILAFIFTGIGSFLGSGSNSADDERLYIAKVDGEGISRSAFERDAQYATQGVGTIGGDDSLQKTIRRSVLSNQINNYLSYKFSDSLKAKISDEQVKNAIRQQTIFFENGHFSNKLFLELLAANGYTPEEYAETLRGSLQQQQVMSSLVNSEFMLPTDADILSLKNQERTIYSTGLSLNDILAKDEFNIDDNQALEYYNSHLNEFDKKERVKLKYIRLDKSAFENAILIKNISDNDAAEFYKANKQDYIKPLMHQYSFIVFDDHEKAKSVLAEINQQSKVNGSSVDNKMEDMGWFAMNNKQDLPSFIIDANLTKKGQTALVSEDDSFIILKLNNIEEEKAYPLSMVSQKVKVDIWRKQVDENYADAKNRLQKALTKGFDSIDKVAEEAQLESYVFESDWSYYDETLSITRMPVIRDAIFDDTMFNEDGSTGKITDIIYSDYDRSDYVLQVVSHMPEGIEPFDLAKDNIIQKLSDTERKSQFKDKVESIVDSLNKGESFDNIKFQQKTTLTRDSDQLDKNIVDMVFSLIPSVNGTVYGAEFESDVSATIAVLTNIKTPEIEETQKNEFITQSQPLFMQNINYYLLQSLQEKAQIEIMPNANL